ncbi:MAG: phage Gp37/Gp68 family protein [Limnochordaceae bacterium]|nr:phage Gp37/Gp68 family protein [Limnochordaceae bacterium]
MGAQTRIEWTQATWNPVTGCSKVSPGCKNCYAARFAERLQKAGHPRYQNGFTVTLHWDLLDLPLQWKRPRLIFVNSMSDLFHERVPETFIRSVFSVICRASHHTFQVLTKRAERLAALGPSLPWPENVWVGVSIENQSYVWRADLLRTIPAAVRFLSIEPLLGPITDLDLTGIGWVIVGGESGPGARPVHVQWVRDLRDLCERNGVPFFFKQWGGVRRTRAGRVLDGREWTEMPATATMG